jgi:hypothetical protein
MDSPIDDAIAEAKPRPLSCPRLSLSFPKIISARNDDAIRIRLVW